MHEREIKTLTRGGLLLAVASVVRLATAGPATSVPPQTDSVLDSLLTESRAAQVTQERRTRALEPGERIDVNAADAVELERLPGIGPSLAARIVAERQDGGRFESIEDLSRVRGIGARSIDRLSQAVQIGGGGTVLPKRVASGAPAPVGRGVDLNRATASELTRLPGVGPVLAERIVSFRRTHGPFRSSDDLIKVPGIGAARLERIQAALGRGGGSTP